MTASKMKKCPVLASNTRSQPLPTYHKQNTSSSNSSSSTTSSLLSSSFNYNCGETTSATASSLRSKRIFDNYLSTANELTMIDGSADKQVDALFDNSTNNNNNNLESRESKLNLTCCHGIKSHDTKETNTMTTSYSFLSNEQLKSIVNKNIQLAPQHWRWKRWYETWLCSRQIGQIKSKRTSSTIATSPALTATTSLVMMKESFSSVSSSWLSYFTTVLVVLSVMPFGVQGGPHERRLINDLMDRYQNLERPVFNESEPLNLKFGLTLQQIIDVDEKNQLLTTNVWLNLEWTDVNLKWNKSEYGGVEDIRIPPHKLWKPDVLMYNSADEAFDGTYPTNVVVTSSGSCTYIPPGIFKSTCKIDITWFPFDDQDCKMKFGSWTYNGFKLALEIQAPEADTSSYVLNGEWALLGVPGERNEVFYECCEEPYLDITFIIKIRRRTLYYFFNLIVPCVLIASMAVLGFTLPPDSGEKLSLGVTVLLSLTVFQQSVSEAMPITSLQIPLLGTYFNCIMFMVASSVVSTIMILNYHHRLADTHEMPNWVRCLFLQWIPWVLRMARPGEKITRKTIMMQNKMKELDLKERSSKSLLANVLDMDDDLRPSSTLPGHAHIQPHHPSHAHSSAPGGAPPPVFTNNVGGIPTSVGPPGGGFTRITPGLPALPPGFMPGNSVGVGDPDSTGNSIGAMAGPGVFPTGIQRELSMILKEIRVITDKIRDEEDTAAVENDWKFAAMVLDRLCLITFTLFTFIATIAVLLTAPHVIVS